MREIWKRMSAFCFKEIGLVMRKVVESGLGKVKERAYVVLAGLNMNANKTLVDLLRIVVLASALEDLVKGIIRAVSVFEIEQADPDVHLFGFFADVNGFDGALGNVAGFGDFAELELEGHVAKP